MGTRRINTRRHRTKTLPPAGETETLDKNTAADTSPKTVGHGSDFIPDVTSAEEFAATIQPLDCADCSWTYDYALRAHDEVTKATDFLDVKADKCIGYTSTSFAAYIGLITLGLQKLPPTQKIEFGIAALPAALLWIAALVVAILAQRPQSQPMSPPINDAIDVAFHYAKLGFDSQTAKVAMAARFHPVRVKQQLVAKKKARTIQAALILLILAVVGALIPLLVAMLRHA